MCEFDQLSTALNLILKQQEGVELSFKTFLYVSILCF